MADLFAIAGVDHDPVLHIIFFHGLGGHPYKTWSSLGDPDVCWPGWLAEDTPGLSVWSIGYDAAVSRWNGSAMPLTDRANNVLAKILAEPRLQKGELILVGHSLGGLLIKQILRTAEDMARQRKDVADFLRRVRRVAFLATPHFGAGAATLADRARIFIRPSAATTSLVRNDSNLRNLNEWYRDWSASQAIAHLILIESRPMLLGIVVKPDSSDPGLLDNNSTITLPQFARPISIDATHIGICKLKDRSSDVYTFIRDFVTRPLRTASSLEGLLKTQAAQFEASGLYNSPRYPKELVDAEIRKSVLIMRRSRFFLGFSVSDNALRLAEKILCGELEAGSDSVRSSALAWCARFLAVGENSSRSEELLTQAKQLGDGPEIAIAEAFRMSSKGEVAEALDKLSRIVSPSARSAAFLIVTHSRDAAAAIEWFSTAGLAASLLDPDGKFVLISKLLELGRWDTALEEAHGLADCDFERAPVLLHTAAMANLLQAIPDELRSPILQEVPFQASIFPLASNEAAFAYRRRALDFFRRSAIATRELGCEEVTDAADDYALWLELSDSELQHTARERLERSMRESAHSLRRLHLALQFGLKLDLDTVEHEIEHQRTLSGGKSRDAALARFSLAFAQGNPKAVADYIDRYRTEFCDHLNMTFITGIEIEMLARAGFVQRAEERLKELADHGLAVEQHSHLRGIIDRSTGARAIDASEAQFERSKQLSDLIPLVALLEEQGDWLRLCHYSSLLFEATHSISDAERLAKALEASGQYSELASFLRGCSDFLERSDNLQMLWSWSLYREGLLAESAIVLNKLRAKRDHPNDRLLTVRLAIASGEWESLLPFIETEWVNRERRTATDLMQVAQLAQLAGSPRAKDLVHQAVAKDPENPRILVAAYGLATSAGWETTEEVAGWLHKAVELSDEKGPIQKGSLRDLLDRAPEWNRREKETWEQVNEGSLPIFCAAHLLNQSLIDLFLFSAIANTLEPDPRKRALVPAYGGARQPLPCSFRKVAMDPTTLLTLGTLGLLDAVSKLFDHIIVPHSTLSWLFEQKEKVSFHQPSRIRKALELRELLANGTLKEFSINARIDTDLAGEVGDELASLIAEASSGETSDERQRVVIRPSPVHRVGSLMDEEADLSSYSSHICSCSSVVDKLKQKGQLTSTEESRARSYLSLHEKEWPGQPAISDNAVLYLDDISVSYLEHAGVLAKLHASGLETYLSETTIKEVNSLLRYEHLASRVSEVIESIRNFLAAGIQSGKIQLAPMRPRDEADEDNIRNHPTFGLFSSAIGAEAIVVDDRSLNKHGNFDTGSERIPILTTLDLLNALYSSGNITLDNMVEYKTYLRRAGYLFVPVTNHELENYLSASTITDGRLVETAELKAIRENFLRIRSTNVLQLPYEATWLNDVMQTFTETLKAQWRPEIDDETARARSEWLVRLLDRRGWAHCFTGNVNLSNVQYWYGPQIILLLSAPSTVSPEIKEKYFQWVDERVLTPIREEDPDLHLWIAARAKEVVADVIEEIIAKDLD